MERDSQLEKLIQSLDAVVAVLGRDSDCCWLSGMRQHAQNARLIRLNGISQASLNDLSAAIMGCYGGMGSFSDYTPHVANTPAPWCSELNVLRTEVYQNALNLRVIGVVA